MNWIRVMWVWVAVAIVWLAFNLWIIFAIWKARP